MVYRISRRTMLRRKVNKLKKRYKKKTFKKKGYKSRYNKSRKTYNNYYSKRKWSRYHYKRYSILDQDRKATWLMSENLKTTGIGNQAITWWLTGYGGPLPTVDPGTAGIGDLRKIWWEETGSAVGNKTRGIFLKDYQMEYNIVNNSEGAIHVTIYDIAARRDIDNDPASLWNVGLNDTALKYIEAGASTTPSNTSIGVTPFHSSLFCQYFRVMRSTKVRLLGGKAHTHKAKFAVKKRYDGEFFRSTDQTRKGFTFGILVIMHGQIINDQGSANEVQYALGSMNTTLKKTINYKLDHSENRDVIMYFNNLNNKTAVTVPVFVQPESGTIDTTMTTT